MPKMMRCLTDMQIVLRDGRYIDLIAGTDVDLDRELMVGLTVERAVMGREECFEPIKPQSFSEESAEAPKE